MSSMTSVNLRHCSLTDALSATISQAEKKRQARVQKKSKASAREMANVKEDLLQQTLRQVKQLKSKLESAERAEMFERQHLLEQIEVLKAQLGPVQLASSELKQSLKEAEELNAKLRESEQTRCRERDEALKESQRLHEELESLKQENLGLKNRLCEDPARLPMQLKIDLRKPEVGIEESASGVKTSSASPRTEFPANSKLLTPQEKIGLFASLFAWRKDLYAVRWESNTTGKHGYSPARKHNYGAHTGSCPGPPECLDQPLTYEVLKQHLQGKVTVGVYPMLDDDSCAFLAIDLDQKCRNPIAKSSSEMRPWSGKAPQPNRELNKYSEIDARKDDSWSWLDDARALLSVARKLGVPAYLERSRSGSGGHLWIFFDVPVSAAMARRLGEGLITRANRDTGQLNLRSYDRMFPNQDTLPKKGYGNLIALPLQKGPLAIGNSAFLDENMIPHEDQWAFLQAVTKVRRNTLEALVLEFTRRNALIAVERPSENEEGDKVDPWTLPPSGMKEVDTKLPQPFPPNFIVTLSNFVYVPKDKLTRRQLNRIERIAAFQNPLFYKNQRLRLSNYNTPRIICCAEEFDKYLALPRGCLDTLTELFSNSGVEYTVDDQRVCGKEIHVKFKGDLRADQKKAAQELLVNEIGILAAVPGFGKTVLAAYCISKRKVNTLVLVHRKQLVRQWKERLTSFLDLPATSIGQIIGGKRSPTGIVDVATIQSLNQDGVVDDLIEQYGQVIVDECHGAGSLEFEQVLRQVKAKWVLGLTATPVRYDGHHPIITMQCGPIRHRVRHSDIDTGISEHVVIPRFTKATLPEFAHQNLGTQEIITELAKNDERNEMIIGDVLHAIAEKRTPLVLTNRKEHLQLLQQGLEGKVRNIIVFRGGLSLKKLSELTKHLEAVPQHDERVVLAIGQCIGEGFDDPRLDTLFLAMPIAFRGRLEQYVGRLHRKHEGKSTVKIYDYVDGHIEKMYSMFKKRQTGYKQIGYKVEMLTQP